MFIGLRDGSFPNQNNPKNLIHVLPLPKQLKISTFFGIVFVLFACLFFYGGGGGGGWGGGGQKT